MFQSHALRGLLLFTVYYLASSVKAEVFVDDDIQAVVIQGKTSITIFCTYFCHPSIILFFTLFFLWNRYD